jgi:hypothetical protein
MAVGAITGAIGWALQSAKATPACPEHFYWHKAREVTIQPVPQQGVFDPEVGGSLLPSGAYKAGVWVAGEMDIYPRIGGSILPLLYSLAGSYNKAGGAAPFTYTLPDGGIDAGNPNTWLTFRRIIPTTGNSYGETFQDCRVTGFSITAQPGNPLTARVQVLGISAAPTDNPSGAGWSPTGATPDNGGYESFTFVPITTKVSGNTSWPTGMTAPRELQINVALGTQQPQREMVVGSYFPDDLTPLSRSVTLATTVNWKNKTLYDSIQYKVDGSFNPEIFVSPITVEFLTPGTVLAGPTEGVLGFNAVNVTWQATPIGLRGGDVVAMRLQGSVIDNAGLGVDWKFMVKNDWPGAGKPGLDLIVSGADVVAPTISSGTAPEVGTIDASTLEVTFSEAITSLNTQYAAGWTLDVDGTSRGLSYVSHPTTSTIRLHLTSAVTAGQTMLLCYNASVGNITDLSGNALANVTDHAVTNNVT